VTPSSVWPSARRLDRKPAACVTIGASGLRHDRLGLGTPPRRPGSPPAWVAPGLVTHEGSSLDVIEKPPGGLQRRRWSRGIHHEAGDLAGHETLHLRFSQPLHLSFLCPLFGETRRLFDWIVEPEVASSSTRAVRR